MRSFVKANLFVSCLCLLSTSAAYAQASLAGVVKDASGAVLPGVTVEAASPALIEKTRTVGTDAEGKFTFQNVAPAGDWCVYGAMRSVAPRGATRTELVSVLGERSPSDAGGATSGIQPHNQLAPASKAIAGTRPRTGSRAASIARIGSTR